MYNLTLLIPGLLGSHTNLTREEQPQFPAIETLLAKASVHKFPTASFYLDLSELFDLEKPAAGDLPIAPLSRLIDGLERPEGVWMRADPVHLAAGTNGLRLIAEPELALSQHDAIILAATLEEFFKEQNWKLEVPLPDRWYVRLPQLPAITTTELDCVIGRDIQPWLPVGPDRNFWHRLSNEIQMILHASEMNRERERRGELPVNSLWFWGVGQLPEILPRKWSTVYSDDPAAQGLAMLSGARFAALPESLQTGVNGLTATGNVLVATATRLSESIKQDFDTWVDAMLELEERWFEPVLSALREGQLTELQVIADGHQFTLHRNSLLKFWSLRRSVIDYLAD
ncbi:MAG: hypothetical protein HW386_888 [Gammaproteobacteria bacterium]|nr:hypothetical protein [Gammaproteobacteria bacterium]